jgi:hypothetical protein
MHPTLELQLGDLMMIEPPRTRWDNRRGRLHELSKELARRSHGFVVLDCTVIRLPLERLHWSPSEGLPPAQKCRSQQQWALSTKPGQPCYQCS